MMDVHADLSGDITGAFEDIDYDFSLKHLLRYLKKIGYDMPEEKVILLFQMMKNFPCQRHRQ